MFFSDVDIYNMESVLILMVDAGHWTNFIRLSFSLVMCRRCCCCFMCIYWAPNVCVDFDFIFTFQMLCSVPFCSIHIAPILLKPKQYTTIKWSARMYRRGKKHIRVEILRPRTLSNEIEIKKRKNFERISHSVYRSSPIPRTIPPRTKHST